MQDLQKIEDFLDEKFGKNVINLTKKEIAPLLRISEATINRRLRKNELDRLPEFWRDGDGPRAHYYFPVSEVAKYLANKI